MTTAFISAAIVGLALLVEGGPALTKTDQLQELSAVVREMAQREREARGIGADANGVRRAPHRLRDDNAHIVDDGGATGNTARTDDQQ